MGKRSSQLGYSENGIAMGSMRSNCSARGRSDSEFTELINCLSQTIVKSDNGDWASRKLFAILPNKLHPPHSAIGKVIWQVKIKPPRQSRIFSVTDIRPAIGLGFGYALAVDDRCDGQESFAIADAPSFKTKAAEPSQLVSAGEWRAAVLGAFKDRG